MGKLSSLVDKFKDSALLKSLQDTDEFYTWHGTPWKFMPEEGAPLGKFRNDKMGSGEGAQAFTWGHYTTGHKPLALQYRDTLADRHGTAGANLGQPKQTKGDLAKLFPDISYVPTLRWSANWGKNSSGSPGNWLGRVGVPQLWDNDRWVKQYIGSKSKPDRLLHDPLARLEAQKILEKQQDWFSPEVVEAARGRVKKFDKISSPTGLYKTLKDAPREVKSPIEDELGLRIADTSASEFRNALEQYGRGRGISYQPRERALAKMIHNPGYQDLYAYAGLPTGKYAEYYAGKSAPYGVRAGYSEDSLRTGAPYIADMGILGRGGLLQLRDAMQDPDQLKELRRYYGIAEDLESLVPEGPLKSLYRVKHEVSPSDLWFLDVPQAAHKEDFRSKFMEAGKAMTPDFSPYRALTSTGHDTYAWLKGVPSGGGLTSSPFDRYNRNKEITDKLLSFDIPGAMFLRGGNRGDLDRVLQHEFRPDDYNFVAYDPDKTEIIERFKKGGLACLG